MIVTEYSDRANSIAKKLQEITHAIQQSQWRKKFAWRKVSVVVPGHDDNLTKSYAWLQWYYTRDVYEIKEAKQRYSSTFDIHYKETVNIPSLDTLSYAAIEYSDVLEKAERVSTGELDRWERSNYMNSHEYELSPVVIALLKKDPFWYCEIHNRDNTRLHRDVYKSMYQAVKSTTLVKGIITPEQYDKIKLLDRIK